MIVAVFGLASLTSAEPPMSTTGWVTEAEFKWIRKGMTRHRVERILGDKEVVAVDAAAGG
jgi:hypothetical protein